MDFTDMDFGLSSVPLPLYLPGSGTGIPRRNCLPASHIHTSDVSLWNILRNNIGKDLSKVSMPVQLNEPLNMLQRLCEELEYSALLDAASHTLDPCERLVFALPSILLVGLPSWMRHCGRQARMHFTFYCVWLTYTVFVKWGVERAPLQCPLSFGLPFQQFCGLSGLS